ncbi:flagellar basal body P-ring formation chaperone FlgA [Aliiroseovarius crassostreae]|uniref:flagellar basal body P-ring formation chaperone FlgA n=1 Tax=Aliiroseovarius crassostreae TaxID=154981 RepID=UPI003C7A2C6A
MFRSLFIFLTFIPGVALADTVLAARTMRPHSVLTTADLKISSGDIPGTYASIQDIVGQETRVVLYAGRPIRIEDVGPPALVDRNQIVTLMYDNGGLQIATEGRSLARGGVGDRVRVMNLSSRSTVTGTVLADGTINVAPPTLPGS